MYIVWSLVRRRVTWRLTWLQTEYSVLEYRKILENRSVRLRFGCGYFSIYLNSVLYHPKMLGNFETEGPLNSLDQDILQYNELISKPRTVSSELFGIQYWF